MSLLFKDCMLIDGMSEEPRIGTDVRVQHGHICEVGPNLSREEQDVQVVDCAGRCLLPGLIDCHVHLCFDGSANPVAQLESESEATTLLRMAHNARQTLFRGVTTVRDLGSRGFLDTALRDAIERGWILGPRIVASGPVITIPGGHGSWIGIEVEGQEAIREAVRQHISAGVDVIKVMATGGRLTPGSQMNEPQFSLGELQVIMEGCRGTGVRVAAHAPGLAGVEQAIEIGVASIEHGSSIDESAMMDMKGKHIFWVPTITPAHVLLETPASESLSQEYLTGVRRRWCARRDALQRGIELGIPLAAGTDAGVTCVGHGRVAWEVRLFGELGLSPMEAVWTATRWAAELLGKEKEIGTIECGKLADLILVPGDPIEDLRVLEKPNCVVKEGKIVREIGRHRPVG
jgi:imidazolonepropionase-like amidohydrolase